MSPHSRGSVYLKPVATTDPCLAMASRSVSLRRRPARMSFDTSENDRCEHEKEGLQSENSKVQQENKDLVTKAESCQLERDDFHTKNEACQLAKDDLDTKNKVCQREKGDLDTKGKTCRREIDDCDTKRKTCQQEKARQETSIKALEARLKEAQPLPVVQHPDFAKLCDENKTNNNQIIALNNGKFRILGDRKASVNVAGRV
ncbi:hypothetical protein BJX66DRAFT_339228 [Aspergillus keveii]|uniref:Uncharacterized protein n=1 Tax=Aspergillus keveii TaxID=714993 RepID=A0ABR4G1Y0_9EURO